MAIAFSSSHVHQGLITESKPRTEKKAAKKSAITTFVSDFIEDIQQKPLQDAKFAKHDMFREHINLMSISYFALIVVLIAASLPILAYVVQY
jgi:hypothetical protein